MIETETQPQAIEFNPLTNPSYQAGRILANPKKVDVTKTTPSVLRIENKTVSNNVSNTAVRATMTPLRESNRAAIVSYEDFQKQLPAPVHYGPSGIVPNGPPNGPPLVPNVPQGLLPPGLLPSGVLPQGGMIPAGVMPGVPPAPAGFYWEFAPPAPGPDNTFKYSSQKSDSSGEVPRYSRRSHRHYDDERETRRRRASRQELFRKRRTALDQSEEEELSEEDDRSEVHSEKIEDWRDAIKHSDYANWSDRELDVKLLNEEDPKNDIRFSKKFNIKTAARKRKEIELLRIKALKDGRKFVMRGQRNMKRILRFATAILTAIGVDKEEMKEFKDEMDEALKSGEFNDDFLCLYEQRTGGPIRRRSASALVYTPMMALIPAVLIGLLPKILAFICEVKAKNPAPDAFLKPPYFPPTYDDYRNQPNFFPNHMKNPYNEPPPHRMPFSNTRPHYNVDDTNSDRRNTTNGGTMSDDDLGPDAELSDAPWMQGHVAKKTETKRPLAESIIPKSAIGSQREMIDQIMSRTKPLMESFVEMANPVSDKDTGEAELDRKLKEHGIM